MEWGTDIVRREDKRCDMLIDGMIVVGILSLGLVGLWQVWVTAFGGGTEIERKADVGALLVVPICGLGLVIPVAMGKSLGTIAEQGASSVGAWLVLVGLGVGLLVGALQWLPTWFGRHSGRWVGLMNIFIAGALLDAWRVPGEAVHATLLMVVMGIAGYVAMATGAFAPEIPDPDHAPSR